MAGITGNSSGLATDEADWLKADRGITAFEPSSAAPPAWSVVEICLGQDSDNMRINLNSWDILKIIIDVELHLSVVLELCALSFFAQGLEAGFKKKKGGVGNWDSCSLRSPQAAA